MAMLKIEGLEGGYGDSKILQGVNLQVAKGSITCLLGPNGSGKTTTLKTVMGLLKPWRGKIEFEGVNIAGREPHEIVALGLSLVPEGRKVFGNMNVIENLQMGAYLKGARDKFNDRIEWIYTIFPILRERRKQKAATLSGGEQSMLTIARALLSDPKLLMLDEPSFGLSPKLSYEVINMLKRLVEENITVLLIEQNIHLVSTVMDYGFLLYQGATVAEGTYENLIKNPQVKRAYLGVEE
jgi:branched-chain amino acid transport system ATP-binding protein